MFTAAQREDFIQSTAPEKFTFTEIPDDFCKHTLEREKEVKKVGLKSGYKNGALIF